MEFVAPDPNAKVRAANVRATLDAFNLVPSLGKQIIQDTGLKLDDLRPENFVPVQKWLDALKVIQSRLGASVVQTVGTRIIENADFPPQFTVVDQVLEALDKIYYLNHQGSVGHYHFKRLPDGAIQMRCETPYPRAFERGLIEGICRNKRLSGNRVWTVSYEDGPPGSDVTCTLTVRGHKLG